MKRNDLESLRGEAEWKRERFTEPVHCEGPEKGHLPGWLCDLHRGCRGVERFIGHLGSLTACLCRALRKLGVVDINLGTARRDAVGGCLRGQEVDLAIRQLNPTLRVQVLESVESVTQPLASFFVTVALGETG